MTHMNHRRGSRESLSGDFPVIIMTQKGINHEGAKPRLQQCYTLAKKWNAVNMGDGKRHTVFVLGYENMYEGMQDHGVVQTVFSNPKDLAGFLKDLKEADLGISTVVSGLFDISGECCQQAGLTPHTVEFSGGVWGRTERMPGEKQLEIMTMCGHGMVPGHLVDQMVSEVKQGRLTAKEAAMRMTKLCICGVVNPGRAESILQEMAAS